MNEKDRAQQVDLYKKIMFDFDCHSMLKKTIQTGASWFIGSNYRGMM